jgi:hypothetical protein
VVATPPPGPVPLSVQPATVTSIAPFQMTRGSNNFYDLHGTGFRAGLTGVVFKGREVAPGITITGQKLVNPSLMRILVRVDATVKTGDYAIVLVDAQGQATNSVAFKVTN